MYQIKTLNKISPHGLDVFNRNKYLCGDDVDQPDGILVRSASMHELEFPQTLRAIARAGAGVNNIPIDRCSEQGIVVFNTPGANANAVKELVICGLLISARKVYPAMEWVQTLKGEGEIPVFRPGADRQEARCGRLGRDRRQGRQLRPPFWDAGLWL